MKVWHYNVSECFKVLVEEASADGGEERGDAVNLQTTPHYLSNYVKTGEGIRLEEEAADVCPKQMCAERGCET
ncbi:hypothetical protein E2C01_071474 [Portunus trituberculatus]|uniref:Uncharacterized protein n=1 Tax=Portunus trituberculatus TaxID=210409 RepID=A0A5B7I4J5_PORTR|nr:hypothetical protein [Portunus trituberculatus]